MANLNGSFGLRPISKLGGGSNSTGLTGYTPYEIANGNTDKIYHGQVVIPLASGYGRLAISTLATTNSLTLRVMGWVDDASNSDFTAAGIGAIVRLNNSFNAPTGSIAAGTVSTTGV